MSVGLLIRRRRTSASRPSHLPPAAESSDTAVTPPRSTITHDSHRRVTLLVTAVDELFGTHRGLIGNSQTPGARAAIILPIVDRAAIVLLRFRGRSGRGWAGSGPTLSATSVCPIPARLIVIHPRHETARPGAPRLTQRPATTLSHVLSRDRITHIDWLHAGIDAVTVR